MLPVYFEDRQLGHIERGSAGLAFTYAADWLADDTAFAISLTMPLDGATYGPETATPWFANLLPEDRQLERVSRLLGRSQGDVYGLLEEIGRDTAGALSIGAPEPLERGRYRPLDEGDLAEIVDRLPARPLLVGEGEVTLSLAGAQTKLAVAVLEGQMCLPLRGAASTHILKPASDRLYASVENELLCLRLAERCGLAVASAAMATAAGRRYLLVERYDRIPSAEPVGRRHQEDLCQALGRYPTQKYERDRGPGLADLFRLLDSHSAQPARDRLALLDATILACCLGDSDRHAKNHALLLGAGGPRLAPCYDLMTALLYDGVTRNLAMKIAGQSRAEHIERRHWERFAQEVGLAPAATVRRVGELAARAAGTVGPLAAELSDGTPGDGEAFRLFAERIEGQARRVAAGSARSA